ncbi:MAG: dihydroorotate dehydrogenase electron transfer subunit, partial [Candidatus Zixiibacteriota bacterium]
QSSIELVRRGYNPRSIELCYGGQSATDILERSRIRRLGVKFYPATENGSLGERGLVTQVVEQCLQSADGKQPLRLYACGPEGMLKAVNELGLKYDVPGQLALEAPMPCGIGICLGCVVRLAEGGYARVCCDGPVFDIGEVIL